MPKLVRSVIAGINKVVRKQNHSTRRVVRLPLNVSLANQKSNGKRQLASKVGFTHDLRKTGISFILSSLQIGGRHLFCDSGPNLEISIQLPSGSVTLKAITTRYDVVSGHESGFLIGARIVGMSEDDRVRYYDFLRITARELRRIS